MQTENIDVLEKVAHLALSNNTNSCEWETPLPNTKDNKVSVLSYENKIYAGSYGYLYELDYNGVIQQTNPLKGRGNHEVRLTISEDGSKLYLGTDGYAICVNANTFITEWQTSLPKTGDHIISVLLNGNELYAAGNGYLYKLDTATGDIKKTNSLSKRGKHEIRLALSNEKDKLFVGTDGYAICTDASTLDTKWQTSLPKTKDNKVSLLVEGHKLYVGSYGYVFLLDYSGDILFTNPLKDRGHHEVRLAYSREDDLLMVGTDGYVLALDSKALNTKWQLSLPHTKDNIVTMVVANNTLYAGSYGYLFQIEPSSGHINYQNNLKGMGHHEVRLTLSQNHSKLILGTNGTVICRPSCGDLAADWDMIYAQRLTLETINKKISFFYDNGYIPEELHLKMDNHTLLLKITSSPKVIENNTISGIIKLSIPIEGEASSIPFKIKGEIIAFADLRKLECNIIQTEDNTLNVSLNLSGDLFESIDLSKATIIGKPLTKFNHLLLDKLNEAMENIPPINVELPVQTLPLLKQLKDVNVHFTYIENGDTSFFGLLFSFNEKEGLYDLSPNTIPFGEGIDSSFIISNKVIMSLLEGSISKILENNKIFSGGDFLELENSYPIVLTNNRDSKKFKKKCNADLKIDKHGIESYFEDEELKIEMDIRYTEIIIHAWHTYHIKLYLSFSAKDGELKIDFRNKIDSCSGGTTCSKIKQEVKKSLDKFKKYFEDGLLIPIHHYTVEEAYAPAFLRIAGKQSK